MIPAADITSIPSKYRYIYMEGYKTLIPRANNRRERVANCSIACIPRRICRVYIIIIILRIEWSRLYYYFEVTPLVLVAASGWLCPVEKPS